jgi:CDP-glycerol glycerophosphotransferase (TagB/SpsB family)
MNKGAIKAGVRMLAAGVFRLCDFLVPQDDRIVLVTLPDGDDQGVSLCLALEKLKWRGKIHWLVHQDPAPFAEWQQRRGLGDVDICFSHLYSLRGIWSYFKASYVFYTHGALFNYAPPKGKLVVNLWHGMPIKKIWRDVPGSELPLSTYLISTSTFFTNVLIKASGFSADQLLVTGLPRNDFLTTARPKSVEFVARLRGDAKLIVKPHPMSINSGKPFDDDAQWAMIDERALFKNGLGLYELLAQVDLLVTDVSSVYVDFLITQRPQILYFPDMERYKGTRGLLLDPLEEYTPGPIAKTFSELQNCLDVWLSGEDRWLARRAQLRDLMIPASPRSAAESLLTALAMHASR